MSFDVIPESLDRTNLGAQEVGARVNLELPLRPTDRLGGHFVLGHVDAVGEIVRLAEPGVAEPVPGPFQTSVARTVPPLMFR